MFSLLRGWRLICQCRSKLAAEALGDESRGAAGNIDVFADQVAVHPRREVFQVEVDVLHAAVELGGEVVAQVFRVEVLAR